MSNGQAGSKWIAGLSVEQPVVEAARVVLSARLSAVCDFLPKAAWEAEQDPEHVHRLRVATRRARAAMEAFDRCAPRRRAKKLNRQLRQVRRAAGEARDLDVQLARLREITSEDLPGIHLVLEHANKYRAAAQSPIQDVFEKLQRHEFVHSVNEFLARLHQPRGKHWNPTLRAYALLRFRVTRELFSLAQATAAEGYEALHLFRIRGKALRYTLEIFAGIWPIRVRESMYPTVEQLQERLGDIVDSHVAIDRFRAWRTKCEDGELKDAFTALIARERQNLAERLAVFSAWWTPERRAEFKTQLNDLDQREQAQRVQEPTSGQG